MEMTDRKTKVERVKMEDCNIPPREFTPGLPNQFTFGYTDGSFLKFLDWIEGVKEKIAPEFLPKAKLYTEAQHGYHYEDTPEASLIIEYERWETDVEMAARIAASEKARARGLKAAKTAAEQKKAAYEKKVEKAKEKLRTTAVTMTEEQLDKFVRTII